MVRLVPNNNNNNNNNDCSLITWNNPQKIGNETGRLRNQRTSIDHPDYSIITISQNTEKSPGDLKRFAVIQTSVITIN